MSCIYAYLYLGKCKVKVGVQLICILCTYCVYNVYMIYMQRYTLVCATHVEYSSCSSYIYDLFGSNLFILGLYLNYMCASYYICVLSYKYVCSVIIVLVPLYTCGLDIPSICNETYCMCHIYVQHISVYYIALYFYYVFYYYTRYLTILSQYFLLLYYYQF